jgi:hypothetical protein
MNNMKNTARFIAGRWLITINAVGIAVGGFFADMNATHMFNDNWPPHAKFHNAQTISFGPFLALASLFFIWRRPGDRQTNVLAAVLFGAIQYGAQACAFTFPGVAWTDPEFLAGGKSLTDFPPQLYIDIGATLFMLFATWLAWPRTPAVR